MTRQTYSIEQINDMLVDRIDDVVQRYAPAVPESYTLHGIYFTLNPGRVDRSVGSFFINMTGARTGRWKDMATGDHGDLVDLIALHLGCSLKDAFREARGYLGLENDTPEARQARERAAEAAKRRRAEAEKRRRDDAKKKSKAAQALWLSAEARIAGTPVERYLRDQRGIDLSRLGRQPRAIRFAPECYYQGHDPETGEVIEGTWPAMVSIVTDGRGQSIACHRTYLEVDDAGYWRKASMPQAKKVLGGYAGGAIHIWSGTGPRGGKGGPLRTAPPDTHVYIAEGIEDALSAVMLLPGARVLSAISLNNMGAVVLPDTVSTVTLVADQDENDQARASLDRAIAQHKEAGRTVRLWQNNHGGKDLNDALRQARQGGQGHGLQERRRVSS